MRVLCGAWWNEGGRGALSHGDKALSAALVAALRCVLCAARGCAACMRVVRLGQGSETPCHAHGGRS